MIGCGGISRLGEGSTGGVGLRDVVPAAQERHELLVLFPGEVGTDAHVRRHVLVVGERPFPQGPGIMTLVAVHGEDLAAGQANPRKLSASVPGLGIAQRGRALREVDRRVLTADHPETDQPGEAAGPNVPSPWRRMVDTVVPPLPAPELDSSDKLGPRSEVGGELHHEDVVVQVPVKLGVDLVGELQDRGGIEVVVDAERCTGCGRSGAFISGE